MCFDKLDSVCHNMGINIIFTLCILLTPKNVEIMLYFLYYESSNEEIGSGTFLSLSFYIHLNPHLIFSVFFTKNYFFYAPQVNFYQMNCMGL